MEPLCLRIDLYIPLLSPTFQNDTDTFNSPGTELFPFSYFAFCLAEFSQVITDIQILITFHKTRTNCPEFE